MATGPVVALEIRIKREGGGAPSVDAPSSAETVRSPSELQDLIRQHKELLKRQEEEVRARGEAASSVLQESILNPTFQFVHPREREKATRRKEREGTREREANIRLNERERKQQELIQRRNEQQRERERKVVERSDAARRARVEGAPAGALRGGLASLAAGGGLRGGISASMASLSGSLGSVASVATLAAAAGGAAVALAALAVTTRAIREAQENAFLAPTSAAALGAAQAREIFARMNAASRLQSDMAQLITLQSEAKVALLEIKTRFLDELLPAVLPLIGTLVEGLEFISNAQELNRRIGDSVLDLSGGVFDNLGNNPLLMPFWAVVNQLPELLGKLNDFLDPDELDAQGDIRRFLNPNRQGMELERMRVFGGPGAPAGNRRR